MSFANSESFTYFFPIWMKVFLYLLAILWNSAFRWIYLSFSPLPLASLIFSATYKVSSDNHFAFLHFFFLRGGLDGMLDCMHNVKVSGTGTLISNALPQWFSKCGSPLLHPYTWNRPAASVSTRNL